MIFHDYYTDVPREEIDRFVETQELARLVTVGDDGRPRIGLYPFVYLGDRFEVHLNRADEQVADLRARPGALLEVDEVLGVIPSYWAHPRSAAAATAYHRTVMFDVTAAVTDDVEAIAAQQVRLLARYQPEGGFEPLAPDGALYHGMLVQLAAITLTVDRVRVKFKLGQNRPVEARRRIAAELRRRGRLNDARAAAALEWTIDRDVARDAASGSAGGA